MYLPYAQFYTPSSELKVSKVLTLSLLRYLKSKSLVNVHTYEEYTYV